MATTDNKHKRSMFNEATRVQMPALVHLTRLGYKYIGKMTEEMAGSVYDPDTNILVNVFKEQFAKPLNNGLNYRLADEKRKDVFHYDDLSGIIL